MTLKSTQMTLPGPLPGFYYRIVARQSNQVKEVIDGSQANGAKVTQKPVSGRDNQLWNFQPTGRGTYVIVNKASLKVLDVEGGPTATGNGARLQQWERIPNAPNQEFRVDALPGGLFRITAVHSNRVVDVEGRSTAEGANVQQWD
jgi:hypothetical protein